MERARASVMKTFSPPFFFLLLSAATWLSKHAYAFIVPSPSRHSVWIFHQRREQVPPPSTTSKTRLPSPGGIVICPYRSCTSNGWKQCDGLIARRAASSSSIDFGALSGKRILVVGGSGRVGGSVTTQLLKRGARVTVGGTSEDSFRASRDRWVHLFPELADVITVDLQGSPGDVALDFASVDRENPASVAVVIGEGLDVVGVGRGYDLIVHTAGPFQGKAKRMNGVLAAAVECGVPYVDVCDDYCTACAAKSKYSEMAKEKGVTCIVSTGCWPGVSSLMAKQLSRLVLKSNTELKPSDLTVDFSFFTAGSGGAGATLLVATFLILAEKALTVVNGRRKEVQAMKDYTKVNFGPVVGDKDVAHLNLLETASVHDVLGVGSVKALFGTAPAFWNALLGVMAQLSPSLLSNESLMSKLAIFSLPIVRIVDYFAGETNAMRCDVYFAGAGPGDDAATATALYAHENLEPCVGECVAAFCAAALSGRAQTGVLFPEEAIEGGDDAAAVLGMAGIGAHTIEAWGVSGKITTADVWGGAKGENKSR